MKLGRHILVVAAAGPSDHGLRQALQRAGCRVDHVADAAAAVAAAGREPPALVLLDQELPDAFAIGRAIGRELGDAGLQMPVLVAADAGAAVGCTCAGDDGPLGAFEAAQLHAAVLRERRAARDDDGIDRLVAASEAMQAVVQRLRRLAGSAAATLLLRGERGVGKRRAARALHGDGPAWRQAMLTLRCAGLAAADLGAALDRASGVGCAAVGTICLHDIDALAPLLQQQLLHRLEAAAGRARLCATTEQDLGALVQAGSFDRRLHERLAAEVVDIPPLRQRPVDIVPLALHFLRRLRPDLQPDAVLPAATAQRLLAYAWPGNAGELRLAVERAVLLGDTSGAELRPGAAAATATGFALPDGGLVLAELERDLLRQALLRTHGNRTRAARLLGINRDRLRYRIHKFHLQEFLAAED